MTSKANPILFIVAAILATFSLSNAESPEYFSAVTVELTETRREAVLGKLNAIAKQDRNVQIKQRQGCLAFLCVIPAFFIGCYMTGLTDRIGSSLDFISVLKRGGVFSIPTAVFALLFPRFWLIPSVLYGLGFYCVTLAGDAGAAAAAAFISIPIFIFGGQRIGYSAPSHKELIWIYLIGIWVAAFIAMLRLHFRKKSSAR